MTQYSNSHNSSQALDPLFFLNKKNYGIFSRPLARKIGTLNAVMLSELISKRTDPEVQLVHDQRYGSNWFHHTLNDFEFETGMIRSEQESAIRNLKQAGLIECITFGLPNKRHFRLNDEAILAIFELHPRKEEKVVEIHQNSTVTHSNCEVCGNQQTRKVKPANKFLVKNQTSHINTNPKISIPKGIDSAEKSAPKKELRKIIKEPEKIERAPNVETSDVEHSKLIDKFGEAAVKAGYEELSEWKQSADPRQVKKHSSDYWRLRKWVIPDLSLKQTNKPFGVIDVAKLMDRNRDDAMEIKAQYPNTINILEGAIEVKGPKGKTLVSLKENGFREQLINAIRKLQ